MESIRMGSGPPKYDILAIDFVNQKPVRFDMALPSSLPIPSKKESILVTFLLWNQLAFHLHS